MVTVERHPTGGPSVPAHKAELNNPLQNPTARPQMPYLQSVKPATALFQLNIYSKYYMLATALVFLNCRWHLLSAVWLMSV